MITHIKQHNRKTKNYAHQNNVSTPWNGWTLQGHLARKKSTSDKSRGTWHKLE